MAFTEQQSTAIKPRDTTRQRYPEPVRLLVLKEYPRHGDSPRVKEDSLIRGTCPQIERARQALYEDFRCRYRRTGAGQTSCRHASHPCLRLTERSRASQHLVQTARYESDRGIQKIRAHRGPD